MVSQREKIEVYESLLHDLYFASSVAMDGERVRTLLDNIGHWSYAHRCGNGELSERQQKRMVTQAFHKLLDAGLDRMTANNIFPTPDT